MAVRKLNISHRNYRLCGVVSSRHSAALPLYHEDQCWGCMAIPMKRDVRNAKMKAWRQAMNSSSKSSATIPTTLLTVTVQKRPAAWVEAA